ncbi:hypothetical protein, partial [Nostoc commune]|uniref:hypothetical protein n=1 Tax=Nostoc commune TaxID=1178 RepID=UPI001E514D23
NSGVRIQESEFRSQNSGVRIQESEFRSQNSGVRIQESELISRGFRPATELLHHQIYDLVGVLNPIIRPLFRSEYLSCILTPDS